MGNCSHSEFPMQHMEFIPTQRIVNLPLQERLPSSFCLKLPASNHSLANGIATAKVRIFIFITKWQRRLTSKVVANIGCFKHDISFLCPERYAISQKYYKFATNYDGKQRIQNIISTLMNVMAGILKPAILVLRFLCYAQASSQEKIRLWGLNIKRKC